MISNRDWGADRETLLLLYKSLVRSIIDYGSFLYSKNFNVNKFNIR